MASDFRFFVRHEYKGDRDTPKFPCFLLDQDDWDDFGSKTSFTLTYFSEPTQSIRIGRIKIAGPETDDGFTILPSHFSELADDCFSLGQDLDFYRTLMRSFPEEFSGILSAINDIATLPGVADSTISDSRQRHSLRRDSEAEQAFRMASRVLEGLPLEHRITFRYRLNLNDQESAHELDFNFEANSKLPSRIHALIGKNGVGKSSLLANMAIDLSGHRDTLLHTERFLPQRPPIGRVLALSFSPFDDFKRPEPSKAFSYRYCGLYSDNGWVGTDNIWQRVRADVQEIIDNSNLGGFKEIIFEALGESRVDFINELIDSQGHAGLDYGYFRSLSSGECFLLAAISSLFANLREDSLVLFDEPEMHLHPSAIGALIRGLDLTLKEFSSYCILSTHSPLVLQEIPSHMVSIISRQGNEPIIRQPSIQTFAAPINELFREVFGESGEASHFSSVLKSLSNDDTPEGKRICDEVLSGASRAIVSALRDRSDD